MQLVCMTNKPRLITVVAAAAQSRTYSLILKITVFMLPAVGDLLRLRHATVLCVRHRGAPQAALCAAKRVDPPKPRQRLHDACRFDDDAVTSRRCPHGCTRICEPYVFDQHAGCCSHSSCKQRLKTCAARHIVFTQPFRYCLRFQTSACCCRFIRRRGASARHDTH